jgi:aspartate racemase
MILYGNKVMILYGLLGGLGPKASAVFLNSLYSYPQKVAYEQELPCVVMLSDSTIPDRTTFLLDGKENDLFQELCHRLDSLEKINVDKISILCFTAHYFQKDIERRYNNFISLIDLGLKSIMEENQEKTLLLCSKATYRLKIFQKSPYWPLAEPYLLIPNEHDQEDIHHIIYNIKIGKNMSTVCSRLNRIVQSYKTKSVLIGCTDLHILANPPFQKSEKLEFSLIDPLQSLIKEIWSSSTSNLMNFRDI